MELLLLHICCGPCSLYPLKVFKDGGIKVMGYFYNPNIHPSLEYMKRRDTLKVLSSSHKIDVHYEVYDPVEYFKAIEDYSNRCFYCYDLRLDRAARFAKERGIKTFTTTLLYSIRQRHDMIKEIGMAKGEKYGINFYYYDFREGWRWGIEESKRLSLYRQNYCGCIFSEKERFFKE